MAERAPCNNQKILEFLAKTRGKWLVPRQKQAGQGDGQRGRTSAAQKSENFGVLSENVGKMADSRTGWVSTRHREGFPRAGRDNGRIVFMDCRRRIGRGIRGLILCSQDAKEKAVRTKVENGRRRIAKGFDIGAY